MVVEHPMTSRSIDHPPVLALTDWVASGRRGVLITLVNIDGRSPRSLGAQMAVCEDGEMHGYLTGGCLEAEFALVAQKVLNSGSNETRRYGKGSPYIDLRLPCGSGIDVYFDQSLKAETLSEVAALIGSRVPFETRTDFSTGEARIVRVPRMAPNQTQAAAVDGVFVRLYKPRLRLNIYGAGFSSLQLALLAGAAGMTVQFFASDGPTLKQAEAMGLPARDLHGPDGHQRDTDEWTATMLVFHDHVHEVPFLEEMINRPGFFLGTIGSRLAAEQRRQALVDRGQSAAAIERIVMSAGHVQRARSASEIAVGVLSQVMDTARGRSLL
jgi:xanthine dehydrogenase accessory factor